MVVAFAIAISVLAVAPTLVARALRLLPALVLGALVASWLRIGLILLLMRLLLLLLLRIRRVVVIVPRFHV